MIKGCHGFSAPWHVQLRLPNEATPNPNNTVDWYGEGQYGFYDLTISKTEILIESINYNGDVLLTHTVYPK